jgi:hypothetical protein
MTSIGDNFPQAHIPDLSTRVLDVVSLGFIVLFAQTFDGRYHIDEGFNHKNPLLDGIKEQYRLFINSFDSHYETRQNGTLINARQQLFHETALHFAVTVHYYFEKCEVEDRCTFTYPFTTASLQRTLSTEISYIEPGLKTKFLSLVDGPRQRRSAFTKFLEDFGHLAISVRPNNKESNSRKSYHEILLKIKILNPILRFEAPRRIPRESDRQLR